MNSRSSTLVALVLALAVPVASVSFGQTIRQDLMCPNGTLSATLISGNTLYIGGIFN